MEGIAKLGKYCHPFRALFVGKTVKGETIKIKISK